jgi:integrase
MIQDEEKGKTTQPLKWSEYVRLVSYLEADHKKGRQLLFVVIAGLTGLRVGDILRLKWSDMMEERVEIREEKTGKKKLIYINQKIHEIVDNQLKKEDLTESLDRRIFKVCYKTIQRDVADMMLEYDIEYDYDNYAASPHMFRKTWGRRAYEIEDGMTEARSDERLLVLSKAFNHFDTNETRRYLGITQDSIESLNKNLWI